MTQTFMLILAMAGCVALFLFILFYHVVWAGVPEGYTRCADGIIRQHESGRTAEINSPGKNDAVQNMDMKTLVVGQKVTMRSGTLSKEGTVDKVTETYVRVRYDDGSLGGDVMGFQYDGTQCGIWEWEFEKDPRPTCTKFGPWKLEAASH